MTLEEAIIHTEEVADRCAVTDGDRQCEDEHRQLAAWLRELQGRRKSDSCEGCKNIGLWENEYEYGVSCPCLRCTRRANDNFEPERRTDK